MVSDKSCRVYVGNLAWSVDEEGLENHMKSAGTVLKTQIFKYYDGYSKGCGIVTYADASEAQKAIKDLSDTSISDRLIFVREDRESKETEEFRGNRFNKNFNPRRTPRNSRGTRPTSEMNNDDETPSYGNVQYRGNNFSRRFPRQGGRPIPREGDVVVNVSNLSTTTTWKQLKEFFRTAGHVTRADVMPTIEGERSGVVYFANINDATNAVNTLNNQELDGSTITVTMKEPKPNNQASE